MVEVIKRLEQQDEPPSLSMIPDTASNSQQKPSTKRFAGSRTGTLSEKTACDNNLLKRQSRGQKSKRDQPVQDISSEQSKKQKKKFSDVSVEVPNKRKTASKTAPQPGSDSTVPRRGGKGKTEQENPELWDNTNLSTHTSVYNN